LDVACEPVMPRAANGHREDVAGVELALLELLALPREVFRRCQLRSGDDTRHAAFSSASSAPCFQSHSMQRSVMPRFVSFLSTTLAWQTGHGCGIGRSQATKSQPFFAQFEQP